LERLFIQNKDLTWTLSKRKYAGKAKFYQEMLTSKVRHLCMACSLTRQLTLEMENNLSKNGTRTKCVTRFAFLMVTAQRDNAAEDVFLTQNGMIWKMC